MEDEHEGDLEPVAPFRPTDDYPWFKNLGPVDHVAMTWKHTCTVERRALFTGALIAFLNNYSVAFLPLMAIPAVSVVANPIVLIGYLASRMFHNHWPWVASLVLWAALFAGSRRSMQKRVNQRRPPTNDLTLRAEQSAVWEERLFREGAEHWTWRQRLTSHFWFACAHQDSIWNAYWPLAATYMLSGNYLMRRYLKTYRKTGSREEALQSAANAHYLANYLVTRRDFQVIVWLTCGLSVLVSIAFWCL